MEKVTWRRPSCEGFLFGPCSQPRPLRAVVPPTWLRVPCASEKVWLPHCRAGPRCAGRAWPVTGPQRCFWSYTDLKTRIGCRELAEGTGARFLGSLGQSSRASGCPRKFQVLSEPGPPRTEARKSALCPQTWLASPKLPQGRSQPPGPHPISYQLTGPVSVALHPSLTGLSEPCVGISLVVQWLRLCLPM